MRPTLPKLVTLCVSLLWCSMSMAQDTTRRSYSIFKPMPRALMREDMETDRPSMTENPHTVEAGHFQYETDLLRHQREYTDDEKQSSWFINQCNLKFGLLKNTALQVLVQSYGKQVSRDLQSGERTSAHGFGDVTVRLKQSLYGNYEGNFSIALIPYIKLPTSRYADSKIYEEGLLVPLVFKLPADWRIGLQVEGDHLADDTGTGRHIELMQSLVVSHVLFKKLEIMGETFYTYNFKDHQVNNFVDAALEFEVTHDLKIDTGINYGLQHKAKKDFFVGLAFRY